MFNKIDKICVLNDFTNFNTFCDLLGGAFHKIFAKRQKIQKF